MFDQTQKDLALDFARRLVAGDFDGTHAMLSAARRREVTVKALRQQFESMIPPEFGDVSTVEIFEDPSWAQMFIYVVIGGPVYSEAIMVSEFVEEQGAPKINAVEFGRP